MILDVIKFYVRAYTHIQVLMILWIYCNVVAAALSLLAASGSAVMTASGEATVSQYHWMHV